MNKEEQDVQSVSTLANLITLVARTATVVAGTSDNLEASESTDEETVQLIGAKLQKKLAPYSQQ